MCLLSQVPLPCAGNSVSCKAAMQPPSPPPVCPGPHLFGTAGWPGGRLARQLMMTHRSLPGATDSHCCSSFRSCSIPPSHTSCTSKPRQLRGLWRWSPPKAFFQPHGLSFIFLLYSSCACNQSVLGSHNNRGTLQAPNETAKSCPSAGHDATNGKQHCALC